MSWIFRLLKGEEEGEGEGEGFKGGTGIKRYIMRDEKAIFIDRAFS